MNTLKKQPSALQRRLPAIVAIVGVLSCLLAVLAAAAYFFLTPEDVAARPLVLFHAPLNGDQFEIGQTASIHATARDENNITRLELWADEVLVEVETTNVAGGISPFPILVNWQPTNVGSHTLTVRAFNSRGVRAHSSINVEAIELPDRDGDSIPDEIDVCPDEASPTRDGCPLSDDRDNDGVPDGEDACPDEAGWADIDGCPTPGDADGDGILDEEDACLEDHGLPEMEGCPDADADSVPDHLDEEPHEPGPADSGGAPDFDGDTVPDDDDLAPEDPGDPEGGGAPESDAPDSDGDGARDDVDPCPHEYGEPEDGYCPPPGGDPGPEDEGPIFEGPGGFFEDVEIPVNVEIEAYEFFVSGAYSDSYQNVWCYVQIADGDMQRYEFEPQGEQYWDIRAVLGGANSVRFAAVWGEPLPVFVNCNADFIHTYTEPGDDDGPGSGGGWGTVFDLGTYAYAHPSSEWDGRELLATGIGPDGEAFQARYRICSPSCEESDFQAPILDPLTFGPRGEGPFNIRWRWDGTEDWITGFKLYVNGTFVDLIEPHVRSLDIEAYQPLCGEIIEFEMTAFTELDDAPNRESPRSNTRVWDGLNCPRSVLVTFLSFDTGAGLGSRQGPISGTFYANDQSLIAEFKDGPPSFDATDDTERYLDPGRIYNISELFSSIETESASCFGTCTSNYAPSVNYIEVELGPREALTFGANIWKEGGGRAFEGDAYVPAGEIVPGEYVVYDNGINMTVLVDVLVGPEAGGPRNLPDLTITDITTHEESGQLRIHVFNNAADLVNEDIAINLVQISNNQQIDLLTWTDITIPSGSARILQYHEAITEPYDLRAIVDPDNAIDETDERNNIYETPASLRVEFTQLQWGQSVCESLLNQNGEFRFRMWVGHRAPDGDINWIAERRQPWAGTIDVDWSDGWPDNDNPASWPEGWVLEGNPLFTFEFDIPADHSLVIKADGYEDDAGVGADDYAGRVFAEYPPAANYGSRPNTYLEISTDYHDCPDGTPLGWYDFNFWIWWRITRIH